MRDTSARTYLSSFYSENTPKNSYLSFIFSYLSSIFRVSLIYFQGISHHILFFIQWQLSSLHRLCANLFLQYQYRIPEDQPIVSAL